jgi:hypothetical protein
MVTGGIAAAGEAAAEAAVEGVVAGEQAVAAIKAQAASRRFMSMSPEAADS